MPASGRTSPDRETAVGSGCLRCWEAGAAQGKGKRDVGLTTGPLTLKPVCWAQDSVLWSPRCHSRVSPVLCHPHFCLASGA